MIPRKLINRWRKQAKAILNNSHADVNSKRLAWRFLKQWGV